MISAEEIDFINKEYSVEGGGSDPTEVLGAGRLSWVSNSGSRQQMFTAQIKQAVMLSNPEVPKLSTGHEKFFGKHADSFKRAKSNYRILAKIPRYSSNPRLAYVLVLQDLNSGEFDVVNVKHFESMSDCHGYIREETIVDNMNVGDIIGKGEYFYKASTIDEDENYRYGVNCKVMYVSAPNTVEDAIICSDSFAKKTRFNLIEKIEFTYDTNHVMLNLYGDNNRYQCLPNIGDETSENSILCGIRSVNRKNISSDLTVDALSSPKGGDLIIKGRGRLIDISVHTNDIEKLTEGEHRSQINKYFLDEMRYHQEIVNVLGNIISNKRNIVSDMLKYVLSVSRNYVNPEIKFSNDNGEFEFCYITAYVAYETGLNEGYKFTNRHGGKGVISEIRPEEYMPVDEDGVRADLIIATAGIIPRLNFGQSYEHEFNFLADKFVKRKLMRETDHDKQIKMIIEFCTDINKQYGETLGKYLKSITKGEQQKFIREIGEEGLFLQVPPFAHAFTIENLERLYEKYGIRPGFVRFKRKYDDEREKDSYISKEYYEKLENLNDNFRFAKPSGPKDDTYLSILDLKEQKKNPLGLSNKDYKEHKWIDDYVWDKHTIGITDENDEEILNTMANSVVLDQPFDLSDIDQFNSPDTKIYKDANGDIVRDFRSPKPMIIADVYYMVLKHIPEAKKFSARNLGPVSLLGLPCKSNKSDVGIPFPDTSNRCGEMETECLNRRIGSAATARWMATHATNPEYVLESARQQLLEDPLDLHDVNIPDGVPKDTIPARTLRAYLGSIGINLLDTGESDPFEWFDSSEFKDVDELLKYIKKNQKKEKAE